MTLSETLEDLIQQEIGRNFSYIYHPQVSLAAASRRLGLNFKLMELVTWLVLSANLLVK